MTIALAFDIYGTLIDPHGIVEKLQQQMAGDAIAFSRVWREKQLEYTWRRGLMRRYADFGICTRQALDYADSLFKTGLSEDSRISLMQAYRELPAYPDVPASLQRLAADNHRLFPFSNGTDDMVSALLRHAAIDHFFEDVISVDSLQTFKPDPLVYQEVMRVSGVAVENCWLVSSNSFDVIGAVSAGMKAAWLRRSDAVLFDPWEIEPTYTISSLEDLPAIIN